MQERVACSGSPFFFPGVRPAGTGVGKSRRHQPCQAPWLLTYLFHPAPPPNHPKCFHPVGWWAGERYGPSWYHAPGRAAGAGPGFRFDYRSMNRAISGNTSTRPSTRSWMQMNGKKLLKMSVSEMCGGATDFR